MRRRRWKVSFRICRKNSLACAQNATPCKIGVIIGKAGLIEWRSFCYRRALSRRKWRIFMISASSGLRVVKPGEGARIVG